MSRSAIELSGPDLAGQIDWAHLERATLGDPRLAAEVLDLFVRQSGELAMALRGLPPDVSALAHKLKGSARGIGAWPVADAAENLETAIATSADPGPAVDALLAQIAAAGKVIASQRRDG